MMRRTAFIIIIVIMMVPFMASQLRGHVSGALGLFMILLQTVVAQLPLLAPLEHVVGPLGAAAAPPPVQEAAATSREGAPPPAATVRPGFLSVSIIVLKERIISETS